MLQKIKRRLREAGWKDYDPHQLRAFYRFFRQVYDPENQWVALSLPPGEFSDAVREEIFATDEQRFTEYVLELREPVVIEPLHGMLVARGNELIKALLAVHHGVDVPPPHQLEYRKALARKRSIDRAVLLRHHYGEGNYFHFFNDLLSMVFLLERFPAYADWPLVVSRALFKSRYFQGFLTRAGWQDRPWVIQERHEAIAVDRLVVAKGLGLTPEWVRSVWRLLRVPEAASAENRRIFLTRAPGLRRGLSNREDIAAVCVDLGFEPVDTGSLTLDEQIRLFSEARYIVAEHGAGSTNVLFRRGQPCTLFELFPPGYVSTCYFLICHLVGHEYRWLRGSPVPQAGDAYIIPPDALRDALQKMPWGR